MKWTRLQTAAPNDIKQERSGHSATLCGNYIFVIGGWPDELTEAWHPDAVLNLNTRQWSLLGTTTIGTFHTTCLVEDKLYCIGGITTFAPELPREKPMLVTIVDLVTHTSELAVTYSRLGTPVPYHSFKHLGKYFTEKGEIVVHGGRPEHQNEGFSDQLFALEVEEMTWRRLRSKGKAPETQSSHMSCVNSHGNQMFVISSYESAPMVGELWLFDYALRHPVWSKIRTTGVVLKGIYGGSMEMVRDKSIIVYGGVIDGHNHRELYVYDIEYRIWSQGKALPTEPEHFHVEGIAPGRRVRQASIVMPNKILYVGGECEHEETVDELLVLEI